LYATIDVGCDVASPRRRGTHTCQEGVVTSIRQTTYGEESDESEERHTDIPVYCKCVVLGAAF
jgi:hypothetical protein